MHTAKPYTNVTFTKRVDHEAGRHRPSRAPRGPRVCERCLAVYVNRRWTLGTTPRARAIRRVAAPAMTVCPACRMAAEGRFGGEVRLSGAFLAKHAAEIERLLRREAERAAEDNPTARILRWDRPATDRLTVTTSTEHLAERLGRAVRRAFKGSVRYTFSHENKFAHVVWMRNE